MEKWFVAILLADIHILRLHGFYQHPLQHNPLFQSKVTTIWRTCYNIWRTPCHIAFFYLSFNKISRKAAVPFTRWYWYLHHGVFPFVGNNRVITPDGFFATACHRKWRLVDDSMIHSAKRNGVRLDGTMSLIPASSFRGACMCDTQDTGQRLVLCGTWKPEIFISTWDLYQRDCLCDR